jgi:hypothetical protein
MSPMKLSIVRGSACGIYRRGNIRLKYAPVLRNKDWLKKTLEPSRGARQYTSPLDCVLSLLEERVCYII